MTNPEQLAFYAEHQTSSDGDGVWVGLCPVFPRMSWCSDRPSVALDGIKRIVLHSIELEVYA